MHFYCSKNTSFTGWVHTTCLIFKAKRLPPTPNSVLIMSHIASFSQGKSKGATWKGILISLFTCLHIVIMHGCQTRHVMRGQLISMEGQVSTLTH